MVHLQKQRQIREIIIASTMTNPDSFKSFSDVTQLIKDRSYAHKVGFHFIVMQDGVVKNGLPLYKPGLFCKGHNKHSIGIIYVGGRDSHGNLCDTRTEPQKFALSQLVSKLCFLYNAKCVGIDTYNSQQRLGFSIDSAF